MKTILALTVVLTLSACATQEPQPVPVPVPAPTANATNSTISKIRAENEEWKKIAEDLTHGRSIAEQEMIQRSQQYYEIALTFHAHSDFDRAREKARKALTVWPGNRAARKLLSELLSLIDSPGRLPVGPRTEVRMARIRIEQTQIEISKHLRDGERYYNARMFDQALREFDSAIFKIHAIPYNVASINSLLPGAGEMRIRSRNALRLEKRASDPKNER